MARILIILALCIPVGAQTYTFSTASPVAQFGTTNTDYRAFMSMIKTPSGCIIGYRDGPAHTGTGSYNILQVSTDGCVTFHPYSGVSYDCGGFTGCLWSDNTAGNDARGPGFIYDGSRLIAFANVNNAASSASLGCEISYSDDNGASWTPPAVFNSSYYWCFSNSVFTYNGHPCITGNPRPTVPGGTQNWICSLDHGVTWTDVHSYPAAIDQDEIAVYWIDNNNGLSFSRRTALGTLKVCVTTTGPTGFACTDSNIAIVTPVCAGALPPGQMITSYTDVSPKIYVPTSISNRITLLFSERQVCTGTSGVTTNYMEGVTFDPAAILANPSSLPVPQILNAGVRTNASVDYGYQSMAETSGSNVMFTWYGDWTAFATKPIPQTMTGAYQGSVIPSNCFAHTSTHGTATSPPMNTTGATLLWACMGSFTGYNQVLADSVGTRDWNTTSEYDINGTGSGPFNMILFKANPTTSTNYTFSIPSRTTGADPLSFMSATVYACSGTTLDRPMSQQTGLNTSGASVTWQPGGVTPIEAGDLLATCGVANTTSPTATINSGFSTPVINSTSPDIATISSWLSAPSTTIINPTWTTNFAPWAGSIAVFKSYTAAPPPNTGQNITTVVGTGREDFGADGIPAINTYLDYPGEIVRTSLGLICFADVNSNRIRCFNPTAATITQYGVTIASGNIATVAGTGTLGFLYNVAPLSAKFAHPVGLAIDSLDCMYVADQQNATIAKFCTTGILVAVAGGGTGGTDVPGCSTPGQSAPQGGFGGDGSASTSALLSCPQGITLDNAGNLIISDGTNYRYRVVNEQGSTQTLYGVSTCAGCIRTILGNGTNLCNPLSTGITSSIGLPVGSGAVDGSGNLFVAVEGCNSVWKLSTAGAPSVIVNNSFTAGYSNGVLGTTAKLRTPFTLKITAVGDLLITDTGNGVIQFLDHTTNLLSTLAGNYPLYPFNAGAFWPSGGYCCDQTSANTAGLMFPSGLYRNPATGTIYVSDLGDSRVRALAAIFTIGNAFQGSTTRIGNNVVK